MRHTLIKFSSAVLIVAMIVGAVAVGALAGTARVRSGKWRVPNQDDVRKLVERVVIIESTPSKTIYLHRGELVLEHGRDDARAGFSSVVTSGSQHTIPMYAGNDASWKRLVACVEDKFAAYDVKFTDQRPMHGDYVLVKVGGSPADIGMPEKRLGGIAPFNGYAIPNSIVFAFDQGGRYRTKNNCETAAHEIGHVYGLDHTVQCQDLMSYRQGCGKKYFIDKPMPCGEEEIRACESQQPAQNSARRLRAVLGAARSQPQR